MHAQSRSPNGSDEWRTHHHAKSDPTVRRYVFPKAAPKTNAFPSPLDRRTNSAPPPPVREIPSSFESFEQPPRRSENPNLGRFELPRTNYASARPPVRSYKSPPSPVRRSDNRYNESPSNDSSSYRGDYASNKEQPMRSGAAKTHNFLFSSDESGLRTAPPVGLSDIRYAHPPSAFRENGDQSFRSQHPHSRAYVSPSDAKANHERLFAADEDSKRSPLPNVGLNIRYAPATQSDENTFDRPYQTEYKRASPQSTANRFNPGYPSNRSYESSLPPVSETDDGYLPPLPSDKFNYRRPNQQTQPANAYYTPQPTYPAQPQTEYKPSAKFYVPPSARVPSDRFYEQSNAGSPRYAQQPSNAGSPRYTQQPANKAQPQGAYKAQGNSYVPQSGRSYHAENVGSGYHPSQSAFRTEPQTQMPSNFNNQQGNPSNSYQPRATGNWRERSAGGNSHTRAAPSHRNTRSQPPSAKRPANSGESFYGNSPIGPPSIQEPDEDDEANDGKKRPLLLEYH